MMTHKTTIVTTSTSTSTNGSTSFLRNQSPQHLQQQQQHYATSDISVSQRNVALPILKTSTTTSTSKTTSITQSKERILFVHIGKTGGETIKQVLSIGCQSMVNPKRRKICYQNLLQQQQQQSQNSKSQLSYHVHGYYHCYKMVVSKEIQKMVQSQQTNNKYTKTTMITNQPFDAYLFTIRHPVERILSWYHYVHPMYCVQKYDRFVSLYYNKNNSNIKNNTLHDTLSRQVGETQNAYRNNSLRESGISCQTANQLYREPYATNFAVSFFIQCFPTIQDWAYALMEQSDHVAHGKTITNDCYHLARQSILGKLNRTSAPSALHLIANYQHYINNTIHYNNNHKKIYVVRTKHLWTDIQHIDQYILHGTGNYGTITGTAITHGVIKKQTNDDWYQQFHQSYCPSETNPKHSNPKTAAISVSIFCCHLMDEMDIYYYLISNASNLNDTEKSTTIQETIDYCTIDCIRYGNIYQENQTSTQITWIEMKRQCRIQLGEQH